jgi:hypothetical protein
MTRYICQQNNGKNLSTYQQNLKTMIEEMKPWLQMNNTSNKKPNLKTMTNTNGTMASNE